MRKLSLLGIVVGGGLVAACLEVDPVIDQNASVFDAGVVDAAKTPSRQGPIGPGRDRTCFPQPVPRKLEFALAESKKAACSSADVDAITNACSLSDVGETASCKEARATYATCAECIFGLPTDDLAKVVTITTGLNEDFVYRPNIHACLDHTSGTEGCGDAYLNNEKCVSALCERFRIPKCDEQDSYEQCTSSAAFGMCPYQVPPGCQESANDDGCMRADRAKAFFTLIINASCGTIADAGG